MAYANDEKQVGHNVFEIHVVFEHELFEQIFLELEALFLLDVFGRIGFELFVIRHIPLE